MRYVVCMLFVAGLLMGGLIEAPPIEAIGIDEGDFPASSGAPEITPRDTISPVPNKRSVLGTAGKNIAVRGNTVVVIFGPPSGDPINFFDGVEVGYSFDGGHTWNFFSLSTAQVRRVYPGVIWPEDWNSPLFFWQEAESDGSTYLPSPIYVAWDLVFPNGVFNVEELPHSEEWDVWLPSADASGDTIIVTGVHLGNGEPYRSFIWRSYDRGISWEADTFITPSHGYEWHDTPIPRIGHDGYVAVITDWIVGYGWDAITPFFLESLDGGRTWIDTINLWDACGWTPYDSASGWWYDYDFVLDTNDRPHIAWKFGVATFEYGDCWYISPTEGAPGAWGGWEMRLIAGEGNGATIVTQPSITYDPYHGILYYAVKGFFASGSDTFIDIGYFTSVDGGNSWQDEGVFVGPDEQEEEAFEFPVVLSSGEVTCGIRGSYLGDDLIFYHAGMVPQVKDISVFESANRDNLGFFVLVGDTFVPYMIVRNSGTQDVVTYQANFKIKKLPDTYIYASSVTGGPLAPGEMDTLFFPPWVPGEPMTCEVISWVYMYGDMFPSNNSMKLDMRSVTGETWLSYLNDTVNVTLSNWHEPGRGWGARFTPPSYPCDLETVAVLLGMGENGPDDAVIVLMDDDGPGGMPGTVLLQDTVNVVDTLNWYYVVPEGAPVTISDGSFYVGVIQLGEEGPAFGFERAQPVSRQALEYTGSWGPSRLRELADPKIKVKVNMEVEVAEMGSQIGFATLEPRLISLFPSITRNSVNIVFSNPYRGNLFVKLYDVSGRLVRSWEFRDLKGGRSKESLNVKGLEGVYFLRLGNERYWSPARKVVILK